MKKSNLLQYLNIVVVVRLFRCAGAVKYVSFWVRAGAELQARGKLIMELEDKVKTITVAVNTKPVEFKLHKATGAEIKATAISQGVRIQQDFLLFEIREHAPLKPIRDDEIVELRDGLKFRATAPDDNS